MPAGAGVITFPSTAMCSVNADFSQHIPDFSSRLRKGGALQAAEKLVGTVILRSSRRRRISHCLENAQSEILRCAQDDSIIGFFRSLFSPALPDP